MLAKPIVSDSIENGLDRKNLKDLKRRFNDINSARLKNTRDALPHRHKPFLDVLPLLLHTNHPLLPGYISHQAPAGIIHYQPSNTAIKTAKIFGKSFVYNPRQEEPMINALFIMGSVGTVAYSKGSDLDIWVCYNDSLNHDDINQLDIKCSLIKKWGDKIGLETHFFTMSAEKFSRGENKQLSKESSGNSQHDLLLDEFYRTAISLGGQIPSWLYVPTNCHNSYDSYLQTLLTKRYIPSDQILDFGVIKKISDHEFISAGTWHLYKAIEAPYKSLIKLLLLESYASPQVFNKTISENLKDIIYEGNFEIADLDPYIMSYRYIEDYLIARKQLDRLHLIRRCLYFKVNQPLSKQYKDDKENWQKEIIKSLVKEWGWTESDLKHIDNRHQWKSHNVIKEKNLLVAELHQSFNFLKSLIKSNKTLEKINKDNPELEILQRKLDAHYSSHPGKIDIINASISQDLSEDFLTFVEKHSGANDKGNRNVWQLFLGRFTNQEEQKKSVLLKKSQSIIELILWCYINGILTNNTHIDSYTINSNISKEMIQKIINDLRYWQPLPLPAVSHESYQDDAHVSQVLIIINADQQPDSETIRKGIHHITSQNNILNQDIFNENLIKTIDLVSINNWNVIENIRLTNNSLTACIFHYLSILHNNNALVAASSDHQDNISEASDSILSVQCHTPTFGSALQQRVKQLLTDIYHCFTKEINHTARYIFEADNRFYACEIKNNKPAMTAIKNDQQLIRYLATKRKKHSPLLIDSFLQFHVSLDLIASLSHDQSIHLIYSLQDQHASIYLLDERGSLYITQLSAYNEQTLLRPLHFFIRSTLKRLKITNLVSDNNFDIYPVKFYRQNFTDNGTEFLQPNLAISDVEDLPFYNVTAVLFEEDITLDGNKMKQLSVEIRCHNISFTSKEYGDNIYLMAAQHIVAQRRSREIYPCYITDINLSHCPSITRCPSVYSLDSYYSKPFTYASIDEDDTNKITTQDFQLIHYFAAKSFIERKLNTVLFSLPSPPT